MPSRAVPAVDATDPGHQPPPALRVFLVDDDAGLRFDRWLTDDHAWFTARPAAVPSA